MAPHGMSRVSLRVPQGDAGDPRDRRGSPVAGAASRRSGGAVRPASRGPFPEDPGIRGPLHPLRLRCPPSPYRSGYASVGRLAGCGASTLSVHGLFRNGSLEAGRREVKRRRAGASHAEPRTEPPSEAAERDTRPLAYNSRCPWLAGGFPSRNARDLRPLAAGSARRDFFLAPQATSSTPPHRLGSPVAGAAAEGGGAQ